MYLKLYDGCKIQDTPCGRRMVIMKLKLVKGKTAYEAYDAEMVLHLMGI